MKTLAFAVALACASTAVFAQGRSNMEMTVIADLQKRGVSQACLDKVTLNDAAKITSWKNDPKMSVGAQNNMIKAFVRSICER